MTPPPSPTAVTVTVTLNGVPASLEVEPRTTLLDALRERLRLTGTKKGCDQGQCGACTVLVDGVRVLSCLTLVVMRDGAGVTTIEGLADGAGEPHPMQRAFVACDGMQCGFCTPGQIMSAVGLLSEGVPGDDAALKEAMSGNLCRCGAYPNIVAAIRQATQAPQSETGARAPGPGKRPR